MTRVIKRARLQLPRDLQIAYTVGRMGVVTVADLWPVFWGSLATARFGFRRLVNLNIVRSFPRSDPAQVKWFSLTAEGHEWVVLESGCESAELRHLVGLSRLNLTALEQRNRLWVSLILASRRSVAVKLESFRPEWALRCEKPAEVSIVPDALVRLGSSSGGPPLAWMVELDSGSERSAVWHAKAVVYAARRGRGPLYGEARWQVLALVPSVRRARTVAAAVVEGGAGSFTSIAVSTALAGGQAFSRALWTALELVHDPEGRSIHSLADGLQAGRLYPDDVPRPSGAGMAGKSE